MKRLMICLLLLGIAGCSVKADTELKKGVAFALDGDYDTAIACYTEVIRIKPDNAEAYLNRGIAYNHKEEYDKAIADFTEAIRLKPDHAAAYAGRGTAYGKTEDGDKGLVDYAKAAELDPTLVLSEPGLQADHIELTAQPNWVRSDVKSEVAYYGLADITLLDRQLTVKVARAFEIHAWVERVVQVRKRPGPIIEVEIIYRRPVAMVEVLVGEQPGMMPVDRFGVVLPPGDFSPEQVREYLRVVADYHQPEGSLGTPWGEDRVEGGAVIASLLQKIDWKEIGLYRVVAISPFHYELRTRNRQRIRWGRAPGRESKGEPIASDKIARLRKYVRQHGKLRGEQDSEILDLEQ